MTLPENGTDWERLVKVRGVWSLGVKKQAHKRSFGMHVLICWVLLYSSCRCLCQLSPRVDRENFINITELCDIHWGRALLKLKELTRIALLSYGPINCTCTVWCAWSNWDSKTCIIMLDKLLLLCWFYFYHKSQNMLNKTVFLFLP